MMPSLFTEFQENYKPVSRNGMTTIEATKYLNQEFPTVPHWTAWAPQAHGVMTALRQLVVSASATRGEAGNWSWSRVPCSYPQPYYWNGSINCEGRPETAWVGVLEISGPNKGNQFLLFSYLDSCGQVGSHYLTSTDDLKLLLHFGKDLKEFFSVSKKADEIVVQVVRGKHFTISCTQTESLILEATLQEEIEEQVFSFFNAADAYREMNIPYRRGFLFTGSPGNGKTLMLRHLIRQCNIRFNTTAIVLNSNRQTDEDLLDYAFEYAAEHAPCLLLLEDVDSLANESLLTRAGLLARLDGLNGRNGILVLGTTNNPGTIDEALVHRPSRFDRVWHFRSPDFDLRVQYLRQHLTELDEDWLPEIARDTEGWSFAYLNELRTTAAIIALSRKHAYVGEAVIQEALHTLATQFQSGKKRHIVSNSDESVGFCLKD